LNWGVDPAVLAPARVDPSGEETHELSERVGTAVSQVKSDTVHEEPAYSRQENTSVARIPPSAAIGGKQLMIHSVIWKLLQSPRAAAPLGITFIYG
jgi:hypothetical protein